MSQHSKNARIKIIGTTIPVAPGTRLYEGFQALLACDGRTYGNFRTTCGGPKGTGSRRFSPSTVLRRALEVGFAVLVDPGPEDPGAAPAQASARFRTERRKGRPVTAPRREPRASAPPSPCLRVEPILAPGATLDRPGLYAFEIEGAGCYVGKFTHGSRPLREYERNVAKMLAGRPYRPRKPDGFRRVHRELARAVRDGRRIVLRILENPPLGQLNARERELIARMGTLNG